MSASVERSKVALALMIGASLLPAACSTKARTAAQPDAGAAEFAQAPEDPLAELEQLEDRMRQLGLAPAPGRADVDQEELRDAERAGLPEAEKAEDKHLEAKEKADEQAVDERDGKLGEDDGPVDMPSQPPPSEPQTMPIATGTTRGQYPAPAGEGGDGESRCTSVCELSESICELEVRICSMARSHGEDPIYSDACERAVDDCELSGDACDTCVE